MDDENKITVKLGVLDDAGCARAVFNDTIDLLGWATFHVETNPRFPDDVSMYCAGYLEGQLMQERMWQHAHNLIEGFLGQDPQTLKFSDEMQAWIDEQDRWARDMAARNAASDPYWDNVASLLRQLDGSMDGYNAAAPAAQRLPKLVFQVGVGSGDLLDLTNVFPSKNGSVSGSASGNWLKHPTHCSALFRVADDLSNFWAAHTSWFLYQNGGLRVAKFYDLHLRNPASVNRRTTLSSYPLFLSVSLDDWYVTEQGLVITETSNSVLNKSIYSVVRENPHVLLSWQRSTLSNRMADSAKGWADIYARHQSGTYNNQWIVMDSKKFEPYVGFQDEAIFIVEQAPGLIMAKDVTQILELGYWPSYNVPFQKEIFDLMGYPQGCESDPIMLCYETCVRAQQFRALHPRVNSIESMQKVIRYNEWKTDPTSQGNPGYAISSRFDLEAVKPGAFGSYDGKVVDYYTISRGWWGQMGPTTGSTECPVFDWDDPKWTNLTHMGIPTKMHFDWTFFEPFAWP